MDNKQFCYWLSGYFELAPGGLYKNQLDIIDRRIEEVVANTSWTCGFIQWLQGVIDVTKITVIKDRDYVNISRVIRVKLEDELNEPEGEEEEETKFPPLMVERESISTKDNLEAVLSSIQHQPPHPPLSPKKFSGF